MVKFTLFKVYYVVAYVIIVSHLMISVLMYRFNFIDWIEKSLIDLMDIFEKARICVTLCCVFTFSL